MKEPWYLKIFPVIRSFENYNLTKFAGDLTGAATVCALRVPQAMAYGLLSGVKPVHGLYCDLIGPWFYGIFGSSPQISVGTFSIVAIMMSISMGRVSDDYCINYNCKFDQNGTVLASTEANGRSIAGHFGPLLSTNQSCNPTEIETHETHCKVTIISVLQILSCLILLIMRFIGFNTILKLLMTKPLVNGFTSACSLWVLSAQFNNFLELKIPKIPGYFSLFKRGYEIVKNFKNVNVPTLIVSVISIVLLYGLKEMNLWYKNKYSSQSVWPCELLLVILGVIFGKFLNLHQNYNVGIVAEIPSGLPPLMVNDMLSILDFNLIKSLLPDAFSLVMVSYSVGLSMGELFAAKYGYDLDANAEAHGLSFAFFGNAMIGGVATGPALARSMVQANSGGFTQLVSLFSSFYLLLILLFLAPLLYHLPRSILSAIIAVNLISLFRKYPEAYRNLYVKKRYTEFILWSITNLGVLILGVDTGLYLAILTELLLIFINLSKNINYEVISVPATSTHKIIANVKRQDLDSQQLELQDKLEEEDVNLLTAFPSGKILKLKGSIFLANADDIFKNLSKDFGGTDLEIRILDISEIGFLDHAGLDLVQKIIERFGISGVVADFAVFEKISKRVGVDLKQVRSG